MATTLADLTRFMDESDLKYEVHEEHSVIAVGFSCSPDDTTYRDDSGIRRSASSFDCQRTASSWQRAPRGLGASRTRPIFRRCARWLPESKAV